MFPPRAPFFRVRLSPRGAQVAARAEESKRGNLPVSPEAPSTAHRPRGRPMSVDAAYAEVQRVTRKRARNFAYGIMVLPREKRRAIAAIYAFARRVDDIADGELPLSEKRAQLEELRAALDLDPGDEAMLVALADARTRFPIPVPALSALVAG